VTSTRGFFSLLITFSSSLALAQKKVPVLLPGPETKDGPSYVTFEDINQMKMLALMFAVSGLVSIIKMGWDWWRTTNDKTKEKLEAVDSDIQQVLTTLQRLEIHVQNLQSSQVTHEKVHDVVRKEIEYISRVREK
jgi:hypothetical protein